MKRILQPLLCPLSRLYLHVRNIGASDDLDDYEKRKLAIFNILNCMGIINGIIIPVAGIFNNDNLPVLAWVVAVSPAFISSIALILVHRGKVEAGKMIYFIFYPFITALVYSTGIDVGIELFFIVYAILGIFLLKRTLNAIVAFFFSMCLYTVVFVIWNNYMLFIADTNPAFYIFNHILAAIFVFFSLHLFKTENNSYQKQLKAKNSELELKKTKIENQKEEIACQLVTLGKQTAELKELDIIKNKLFSVIAHDLKTPMYALRNMFTNIRNYDLPGEEIKLLIPDVVTDLNYTTGLMENLLHWAKSQMQVDALRPQILDVTLLIKEVMQLLRLQAESKKVYLENKSDSPVYIYADRDMVNLVLRNLLSNAIKFTPENGSVYLGASDNHSFAEIYVQDTGLGMSEEVLQKINDNNFFTSKGTSNESGTGLGLMLCREFLAKNGGKMFVESELGKGSVFSFTLPHAM